LNVDSYSRVQLQAEKMKSLYLGAKELHMKNSILCFGETLWDKLPDGKKPGGAPMNVALHVLNFEMPVQFISRVGTDELGEELLQFMQKKGLSTELVQRDTTYPTGTVDVNVSDRKEVAYEIVCPVAWDFIEVNAAAIEAVKQADVLVFGSLATRNSVSRQTLLQLLAKARQSVFDVNLRPPHFTKTILEMLLAKADIVKMNEHELEIIARWHEATSDIAVQMRTVLRKYNLQNVIVTLGEAGAWLFDGEQLYKQAGFPIKVEDTIGSGDSFLAGLLSQLLSGKSPQESLQFASAVGAIVATHKGANPKLTTEDVLNFIKTKA